MPKNIFKQAISNAAKEVDIPYIHSKEGQKSYGRGWFDALCVAFCVINGNQKKAQPMYPPKEYTENKKRWEKEERKKEMRKRRVFGNYVTSDWFCSECKYHIFPTTLFSLQDDFVWTQVTEKGDLHPCCPKCATILQNDEQPIE